MAHADRPFPAHLVSIPTIFDATISCVNGSHCLFLIALCIFAFALQEPILLLLLIENTFLQYLSLLSHLLLSSVCFT